MMVEYRAVYLTGLHNYVNWKELESVSQTFFLEYFAIAKDVS